MKIQYLSFLTIILLACGTPKAIESNNNSVTTEIRQKPTISTPEKSPPIVKQNFNVNLTIQTYTPYCGGTAPTEDQLNNYHPTAGNFILVNKLTHTKTTVTSNSEGIIKLNLEKGQYAIRETFKDTTFEAFYKLYSTQYNGSNYVQSVDNETCYQNWWSTNLINFELNDTITTVSLTGTISSACFTGNNPCIQYTGPYPP